MVVRLCTSPIFVFSVGKVNPRFPVVAQVSGVYFMGVCLVAVVAAG